MNSTDKHGVIIGGCTIAICFLYIRFLLSDLSMSNWEWGLIGGLFLIATITFFRFANKQ